MADTRAKIIRDGLAAGMTKKQAAAHADKILAERDIVTADGGLREPGPSIFDLPGTTGRKGQS